MLLINMLLIALASAFSGGDSLEIITPKTTLRAGETVQIKVIKKLSDGTHVDATNMSTGTEYFSRDPFVLVYEPDGKVTAINIVPGGIYNRYGLCCINPQKI
jgi:hypothetical protein